VSSSDFDPITNLPWTKSPMFSPDMTKWGRYQIQKDLVKHSRASGSEIKHFRRQHLLQDFHEKTKLNAPNYQSNFTNTLQNDPNAFWWPKGMCSDLIDNGLSNLYISTPFGRR